MATSGKDVIYIDVDDEITTIIDKVVSAKEKIVALVLPKRATVFQSIVNMKLLKHRADTAKKHLVLITSEAGLMPLAGAVGLHVAPTLQSRPEVPVNPVSADLPEDKAIDEDDAVSVDDGDFDPKKESVKSVGELAKAGEAPGVIAGSQMPEETIELDNSEDEGGSDDKPTDIAALAAAGSAGKGGGKKKGNKDKKLRVPNFDKFRLKFIIAGVLLVLLIVAWIVANNVLPKAVITIKTATSTVNTSLTPTLSTTATSVDTSTQVIPAVSQQVQKPYSQQVAATGQQNNGQKATGQVMMVAQECAPNLGTTFVVPAGTGLSANGLTFITQSDTKFDGNPKHIVGSSGSCNNYEANSPTNVQAQSGGSQYNISQGTFTVAGFSNVTASVSIAIAGGTDSIQTIVQQSDIDSATQKLTSQIDKNAIKTQLQQALTSAGEFPITDSFTATNPTPTVSPAVGTQSSTVTVSETVTYTMFGAKKSDLQTLIDSTVKQQINTAKQAIQDDGFGSTAITVPNAGTGNTLQIAMQSTSVIGPQLNLNSLKQQVVGLKAGAVQTLIEADPGVQGVSVKFSPFWVDTVPKHLNKITINFEKS